MYKKEMVSVVRIGWDKRAAHLDARVPVVNSSSGVTVAAPGVPVVAVGGRGSGGGCGGGRGRPACSSGSVGGCERSSRGRGDQSGRGCSDDSGSRRSDGRDTGRWSRRGRGGCSRSRAVGRVDAEVGDDVGRGIAGKRRPIIVRLVVNAGTGADVGSARDCRAALTAVHVHAVAFERAFLGFAVDVREVVPDVASQGVLELSDGAADAGRVRQLEGDSSLAGNLVLLRVRPAASQNGRLLRVVVGIDRPEVDGEVALVVDDSTCGLDNRRSGEESGSGDSNDLHDGGL